MLKSLLVLVTVVLMSTPAMAFAPKGKWKEGGPNPPGHAYGLRARQSSMHDPETCTNPCHDHERDRDRDDDDRNDQGDDDDDGRDNRDLDRRPVPDPSETRRRPERRDDVTPDPRSPGDVQDDIREVDAAIRRERDTHEQRAEEREYADRRAELEREITKAMIRRDDLRRAEITAELDTLTAQHERRIARLKVRLAVAKSQRATRQTPTERFQAHLDDAQSEVRRVRRTVGDIETGIDTVLGDVRWIVKRP